jgi:hypothetical protein
MRKSLERGGNWVIFDDFDTHLRQVDDAGSSDPAGPHCPRRVRLLIKVIGEGGAVTTRLGTLQWHHDESRPGVVTVVGADVVKASGRSALPERWYG